MLRAVIFDIDGTLLDSVNYHAQAWVEIFSRFGREVPFEDVRQQIGKGGDQLMPVFFPKDELDRVGERMQKDRASLFKERYLPLVRPFPKVRELFQRIRKDGKALALASSASGDEMEAYKRIADVGDLLEAETSSDDAERSKPHPDIFLAALERLGNLDPANAVVVGDTPYDAVAAGRAGLQSVGVLCGGFPEAELRAAGCGAIFKDPAELLVRYERSPLAEHR